MRQPKTKKINRTCVLVSVLSFLAFSTANASQRIEESKDGYLIKFKSPVSLNKRLNTQAFSSLNTQSVTEQYALIKNIPATTAEKIQSLSDVEYIQPNYKVHLLNDMFVSRTNGRRPPKPPRPQIKDNPEIPAVPVQNQGADPLFSKQWGMNDIHVSDAWQINAGTNDFVVAVIDTGVDYTHPDLLPNMWRNKGEQGKDSQGRDKATNGVDDDNNGFIDDVVGWDFVSNDNKPFDLSVPAQQLLLGGGNPGHGTHCAGNVAAKGNNSVGISGVAPNAKIMALRFLSEKGEGTTAEAIKAIKYAVDNGAKITSNSWGSEGEDPAEETENKALKEVIKYSQDKGTLFIAAAGNGHNGVGYNNDTDSKPGYPASYTNDNIISVAAIDNQDRLGSFSNWGLKSVDIAAPGVAVFSTTVGGKYSDKVIDISSIQVGWDGTSMATPHVAGAAALYWSANPTKTWSQVKAAVLKSATAIAAMNGKSVSGGKLDVLSLMRVK